MSAMRGPHDPKPVKLVRRKLDAAALEAHLDALAASAREVEVRIKGAADAYSAPAAEGLAEVGRRLRDGAITAVQLRFFLDDAWWCDTLMRAGDGFRLVRMRQD